MFLTSVAPITGVTRRKYDDDDVAVAMLKACRLPSSVSNLLHWEIALFTRRPWVGGAHMAWEKYAGIKTEKEHKPRISIENCWRRGSNDIGEFMNGKRDKNHETVLFAFATWINLQYHSEKWSVSDAIPVPDPNFFQVPDRSRPENRKWLGIG